METQLSQDPTTFATLATQLSACPHTKHDGGIIGWVDTANFIQPTTKDGSDEDDHDDCTNSMDSSLYFITTSIIPKDVLTTLIQHHQPKTGDIHVIPSKSTNQIHIVKVEELWLRPIQVPKWQGKEQQQQQQQQTDSDSSMETLRIGSHSGLNAQIPRTKRLKGQGTIPNTPTFVTSNISNNNNDPSTYLIQTNGCQMNVADSERLEGILQTQLGLRRTNDPNRADILIVNTCSIREGAEKKLYDVLGPYRARKRAGDSIAILITGCVAQQEGQQLLETLPEVDVVVGPQYIPHLGNVLQSIAQGHQLVLTEPMLIPDNYSPQQHHQQSNNNSTGNDRSNLLGYDDDFSIKPIRGHSVRAWVNAIYGCNEHCSYCVVPATRGMEQSRSMESILQECLDLIQHQGYKEVTLLGQNIDAYGRDMVPKRTFADLLHYLNANIPNKARIRYVTSHPRYFSDRVIDAVATLDKVCECFHMPFQAGDNAVLKEMRRGYTYESYMKIIDKIRAAAPDAAITADVIVGFPGETEEAFQRTLDLMEAVHFDNLNSFAYSPRPNTEAALWQENQIPEDVKRERLARVQELAAKHAMERSQRYVGTTVEVLVEDTNPRSPQQVMGRTRQGRQVYFDGDIGELLGNFVNVEIVEARTWSLVGKRIQ
ncbi:MiaB family RNA modification protein [Nitzschia inconspicua]|uniref:MiaB family RNA modification protein n=1 Tax=Nitzschia inconspicua TaxID=303405 RepID=A0A9K3PJA6_9STRA|nr:MiaB family RNA modification protein [Nitzschia inconspicua]